MSDLLERLRTRGWRLTPQRRVVAEVLTGDHVHLTAEEVYSRAQALLPEIGLATVYNTLKELVALGEVIEVTTGAGPKRYDPNVGWPHQHLVCIHCGDLRDVYPTREPALPASERHGFAVLDAVVTFRGVCPRCAASHPDTGAGPAGGESPAALRGRGRARVSTPPGVTPAP